MVPKRLVIIITFSLLLALAIYGAQQVAIHTMAPSYCAECHPIEYSSYAGTDGSLDYAHGVSGISCYDCHSGSGTRGKVEFYKAEMRMQFLYKLNIQEPHVEGGKRDIPERCIKCHPDYVTVFAGKVNPHIGVTDCSVCHKGHQQDIKDPQCASCHEKPYITIREAGGRHATLQTNKNCAFCHQEHRLVPDCQDCHGVFHNSGFDACNDCHMNAHAPRSIKSSAIAYLCADCHVEQGEALRDNPSKHTNIRCMICHLSHGEIPTCDLCHEGHATTLANYNCTDCHVNGHAPKEVQYPADAPSDFCIECHAGSYQELLDSGTKHTLLTCAYCHPEHGEIQACSSCHRPLPHGTTFTDCATCHETAHNTRV